MRAKKDDEPELIPGTDIVVERLVPPIWSFQLPSGPLVWYSVELPAGTTTLHVDTLNSPGNDDTDIAIYGPTGLKLGENDDLLGGAETRSEIYLLGLSNPAIYYIAISVHDAIFPSDLTIDAVIPGTGNLETSILRVDFEGT